MNARRLLHHSSLFLLLLGFAGCGNAATAPQEPIVKIAVVAEEPRGLSGVSGDTIYVDGSKHSFAIGYFRAVGETVSGQRAQLESAEWAIINPDGNIRLHGLPGEPTLIELRTRGPFQIRVWNDDFERFYTVVPRMPAPASLTLRPLYSGPDSVAVGSTLSLEALVRKPDGTISATALYNVVWTVTPDGIVKDEGGEGVRLFRGIAPGTAHVTVTLDSLTSRKSIRIYSRE